MPSLILPEQRDTGGILHLPDALKMYPDVGIVLLPRVSGPSQASNGKLDQKTFALYDECKKMAPEARVLFISRGVEEGKLSVPRPGLERAVQEIVTSRRGAKIILASDMSRFIRSESYCRQKNWDVWPTPEEFNRLREMTCGAVLATLLDPQATESERHSYLTKRTGQCGRPRTLDRRIETEIREAREVGLSYGELEERFGVTKSMIQRILKRAPLAIPIY